MANKYEKVDKAFLFFLSKRTENKTFKMDELQRATSWELATVRTYTTKRWESFLVNNKGSYAVTERYESFNKDTFRQHHSQKEQIDK